ncbi:MAG: NAD(P)/FAD-dependent oxidoreductase [Anaerotignaceae bacterium]
MEIVIVGSGPAGVSAALYTARSGIKTTIISNGKTALNKAHKIENYYGFSKPISGDDLYAEGIEQAKALGVEVINGEIVGLSFLNKLAVLTTDKAYEGDAIILATGSSRNTPNIKGLKELEGKGISYCAVCDGFFFKNKPLAVLGSGQYALHEAMELLPIAQSVTILTDGKPLEVEIPKEINVITHKILEIGGNGKVEQVVFDNESIEVAGIFVAQGVAGSGDLAKKIGAQTEGTKIVVDENMSTNVAGLYAAGDCTGGMLQIAKAVYEGAKAGTEVVKYLRNNVK